MTSEDLSWMLWSLRRSPRVLLTLLDFNFKWSSNDKRLLRAMSVHPTTTRRGEVVAISLLRLIDVTSASQMKHPMTSRWTSYCNVTTSEVDVTMTLNQYVYTTSQTSIKWITKRRRISMLPRRSISKSLRCIL